MEIEFEELGPNMATVRLVGDGRMIQLGSIYTAQMDGTPAFAQRQTVVCTAAELRRIADWMDGKR